MEYIADSPLLAHNAKFADCALRALYIAKVKQRIVMLHRIKRRRLLPTVNEMMAAHKNAVVIANIWQN